MDTGKKIYDLIIVGGGACGLAAAAEASEKGLDVIILEKRSALGGNGMFAGGLLGAETHVQKRQMHDVRKDEVFQAAMSYAHWLTNARILRRFIDRTPDTIKWLEDKGVPLYVDNYIPGQKLWTYHKPVGNQAAILMKTLMEEIKEANIPIMTNTPAKEILKDENGAICGVRAEHMDNDVDYFGRNVMIATGGYSGNKEMLKKYYAYYVDDMILWGLAHNGDGIRMVTEAGADNVGLGILQLSGPHVPDACGIKVKIPEGDLFTKVSALAREPYMVWVNKHGKRFADEKVGLIGHEGINAVVIQKDQTIFSVFDDDTVDYMENHGLVKGLTFDESGLYERSGLHGLRDQMDNLTEGYMYIEHVDEEKCKGCGICVVNCPASTITLDTIVEEKNEMSPCRFACPAHVDIRSYNHLLRMGRKKDAMAKLSEHHPMPAVTGRVCPHFCEDECARCDVDEAVNINQIERFLGDEILKTAPAMVPNTHEEKIAVIGAGPAGLSCAYFLKQAGYPVTVFEASDEAGGMLLSSIPSFRLPKDVVRKQIAYYKSLGIEMRCGVTVGKDISIEDLRKQGYRSFFIAVGLQHGGKLNIPGEDAAGVASGFDFAKQVNLDGKTAIKGNTVVIGGGNIAADVARMAVRCGADRVDLYCLECDTDMPMGETDRAECEKDGVVIHAGWGPVEILNQNGHCSGVRFRKCVSVQDAEGKFAPSFDACVTDEVRCDHVLYCIGQKAEWGELLAGSKVELNPNGTVKAEPITLQTAHKDIFAGGDACHGQKYVVDAIAAGKESAVSIERYLTGADIAQGRNAYRKVENPPHDNIPLASRNNASMREPDSIAGDFAIVNQGLDEEQITAEVHRCMTCGSLATINFSTECARCRNCETSCPEKAIEKAPVYKAKPLVKRAETIEELAEWIGTDPAVLCKTIDTYNVSCDHGHDVEMAKDPYYLRPVRKGPFYAIECHTAFLATVGGIRIDEYLHVLDKEEEPIPHLYAGGNDTGGWEDFTYNVILSGSTLSFAINSGRMIVDEIAEEKANGSEREQE